MAAAEQRTPGAAGAEHGLGANDSLLGDDAGHPAAGDVETAGGAILMESGAALARRLGEGRGGEGGLAAAVARRMHAADPVGHAARRHRLGLGWAQDAAVHLVLARAQGPFLPFREISATSRDVEQAGVSEAGFHAQFGVEALPYLQALHGERQLAQVAVLLAAPAPVPAALLAADHALVEQGDLVALLRQGVGGRRAGDAGADHDDVGGGGELVVADDGLKGRGHRFS